MIRIELGAESSPGLWEYSIPSLALCGKSRQPLLDGCRQIKQAVGSTVERAGVFRGDVLSISCSVDCGDGLTVAEPDNGTLHFVKYRPFISNRNANKETAA